MNMANGTKQMYRLRRFFLRYHGTLSFLTKLSMIGLLLLPPAMAAVFSVESGRACKTKSRDLIEPKGGLYGNNSRYSRRLVACDRALVALACGTGESWRWAMCPDKTSTAQTRVALELLAHWQLAGGVELPDYNRNGAAHRLIVVQARQAHWVCFGTKRISRTKELARHM